MKKKFFLKKSYIRDEINVFFTNFFLCFLKRNFKDSQKIIVKMTDGLGDIVIRSKLIEKIIEEYKYNNVFFLVREEYGFLGEVLEFPIITISRKERYNLIRRIKKMYQINKIGIKKFINLEWSNDDLIRNIYSKEKLGIEALEEEDKKNNNCYTTSLKLRTKKIFNEEEKNVIDFLKEIAEFLFDKPIEKEELIPNLKDKFCTSLYNEGIVIGVGATDKNRICNPYKMSEYIKKIVDICPEEKIYLVGGGKSQEAYSKKIIELCSNENIVNLVNKTNLQSVLEIVAKAKIFIGFDSGLYNFRYTLRKKQIALFRSKKVPYAHNEKFVKILEGKKENLNDIRDENYSNLEINNISVDEFEKSLIELLNL